MAQHRIDGVSDGIGSILRDDAMGVPSFDIMMPTPKTPTQRQATTMTDAISIGGNAARDDARRISIGNGTQVPTAREQNATSRNKRVATTAQPHADSHATTNRIRVTSGDYMQTRRDAEPTTISKSQTTRRPSATQTPHRVRIEQPSAQHDEMGASTSHVTRPRRKTESSRPGTARISIGSDERNTDRSHLVTSGRTQRSENQQMPRRQQTVSTIRARHQSPYQSPISIGDDMGYESYQTQPMRSQAQVMRRSDSGRHIAIGDTNTTTTHNRPTQAPAFDRSDLFDDADLDDGGYVPFSGDADASDDYDDVDIDLAIDMPVAGERRFTHVSVQDATNSVGRIAFASPTDDIDANEVTRPPMSGRARQAARRTGTTLSDASTKRLGSLGVRVSADGKVHSDVVEIEDDDEGEDDGDDRLHEPLYQIYREYGLNGVLVAISEWLNDNQWLSFVIAAVSIVAGMMTTKYLSVIIAIVMLGIGYLVERQDDENDSMMTYSAAIICFMVPFLY